MLNINKNSRSIIYICNRICIKIMDQEKSKLVAVKIIHEQPSVNRPSHSQYQFSTCFLLVVLVVSFRRMKKYLNTISLCAKCSSSWKFWISQLSKIKTHTSRLPYHIINMGYWPRLVGYWSRILAKFFISFFDMFRNQDRVPSVTALTATFITLFQYALNFFNH